MQVGIMTQQVDELLRRYNAAKSRSLLYWNLFTRVYQFVIPDKDLYNQETEGINKSAPVYDTTAVKACDKFVSKVQASIVPPGEQWVKFVIGPALEEELKGRADGKAINAQITAQLQQLTDIFFKYLNVSNFALVANESFYDLAVGTATILCNEGDSDDNPLNFSSVPLRYYVPEEGPNGQVNTQWQEYPKLPARCITQLWRNAIIPEELQNIIDERGETQVQMLHGTVYNPDKKNFCYYVIWMSAKKIIYEEESDSSPWITFRWSRVDNEVYGRGPAIKAYPTVRSLNKMAEYEMIAGAFASTPTYTGMSDGIFNPNNVSLKPNTIIPTLGGAPLQRLDTGGDVKFSEYKIEDLREQVNAMFFADPLGAIDTPAKTATEISYRQQMFAEEVGPAFGRLQVEFLDSLTRRIVFILKRRGLFPNIEIDGKQIDVSYQSPLQQTQSMQEISEFQQFMSSLQQMFGPELTMAAVKPEQIPQWLAEKYDVNMDLVKNADELAAAMAQVMQQQQQQQPQLPAPGVSQLSPTGGAPQ